MNTTVTVISTQGASAVHKLDNVYLHDVPERFIGYLYQYLSSKKLKDMMEGKYMAYMLLNLLGGLAYITAWVTSIEPWKQAILFVLGVVFLCLKIRLYYINLLSTYIDYKEKRKRSESAMKRLDREDAAHQG